MFKTEVFLSYQKPQGERPYVVLTMKDFLADGRMLTHVSKITRQAPDLYREQVTHNGRKLSVRCMEEKGILQKYGSFIGSRIIGHL